MSKLLALTLAGLLGISVLACESVHARSAEEIMAESRAGSDDSMALLRSLQAQRDAKARDHQMFEQQQRIRALERQQQDQRNQNLMLQQQRNAARQHQCQRPIPPPLYNPPPISITP